MRRCFTGLIALMLVLIMVCPALAEESEHYFGKWRYRRDGFHRATCQDEGCDFTLNAPCTEMTLTYEGESFSFCPVCGHNAIGNGRHRRCLVQLYNYDVSPVGDVLINQYRYPFGRDSDVVSAFSVIFEHGGVPTVFNGLMTLQLTIDCPASYELLRVEGDTLVSCESSYDAFAKRLTFEVPAGSQVFVIKKAA